MPEQEKTDNHQSAATDKKDAAEPTKGLLRWTLIVGTIGFLILIVVSVYHPHLTERAKFLVGSSLSLFVLLAVIVQAVIYRGQWKAMREQRTVMSDQLKTMRDSLTQNQQAMEKSWLVANAQGIAACEQLIAMRQQTLAMQGQLAAMNRQEGHLLTQATAAKDAAEMAKGQLVAMQHQEQAQFKSLEVMQGQLEVMKDQVKAAGKQSELAAQQIELMVLSECAYVTVGDNWRVDEDLFNNNVLVVHGKLHNGGRTPALNFRRKLQVAVGDGEPPPGWGRFDWDSSTDDSESIVLVSDGEVNCSTPPMKLTNQIASELVDGKQMVVIDGQGRYLDILGGEQVFTFGVAIDWVGNRALIRYQEYRREKTDRENPN